ncbi:MAG: hypothetical protein KOO60_06730 [Gemmatimonadales bacterium]|nr:hypothetical protein [Gemmatimonadales bacterium]
MENSGNAEKSYWDLIVRSEQALTQGDFPLAEKLFHQAHLMREESPGRVFISEKITDGLVGMWGRARHDKGKPKFPTGRWNKRCGKFREEFTGQAERVVREGVRLAELRPEDDAEANQPILEAALFLVSRSRLFREEPASSVPLLMGLFRTARRTGRPFDVQLVRHDIPLTEEDRLWLARRGGELLETFVEDGHLAPGSKAAEEWAAVFLQLLQVRYFGSTSRLEEERSWLEAVTADRFLDRGAAAVALYREYLQGNPEPGTRADEARVRLLEMLGNCDRDYFPIPLYPEAMGAMQSAGLSAGNEVAGRYEAALARIEYRRPDSCHDPATSLAWATLSLESDGSVGVVFWWGEEPRDVGFWHPGDDPEPLEEFLAPCGERLVLADPGVLAALGEVWTGEMVCWTARDFATALINGLPRGIPQETPPFLEIALNEAGPWRGGWKPSLGNPILQPPRTSAILESWGGGPVSEALLAGLIWLGVRSRIARVDPTLRAGIGELARRGDEAAGFLYEFLVLDGEASRAVDQTFEPWTLSLLWTRPDPVTKVRSHEVGQGSAWTDSSARPDLGRNDLAIVSTGDPAAVLAAWNDGQSKWRIVLDRADRLDVLAGMDAAVIGPSTVIPPGGTVHSLEGALQLLESMLGFTDRPTGAVDGLLPLFHWRRLVETHNGDLLDFLSADPQTASEIPLFKRYVEWVADVPREEPSLGEDSSRDSWAGQFSQRVRKSGLVVGTANLLDFDSDRLNNLWGVFEGSGASWVWLDSAAIHSSLLALGTLDIPSLHGMLHQRGRRHLSLLTGAVWHRQDVEEWLSSYLQIYGDPYCLAMTDCRVPTIRLVAEGFAPDSLVHRRESLLGTVARIEGVFAAAGGGTVLLPGRGLPGEFWSLVANAEIDLAREGWSFLASSEIHSPLAASLDVSPGSGILAVPVLASLEDWDWPQATEGSPQVWAQADRDRRVYRDRLRRACSLEIAGLLAGPWETVEILDARWQRLFPADEASRTFDQPRIGHPDSGPIPARLLSLVDSWLDTRPGNSPIVGKPDNVPPTGIRFVQEDPAETWDSLQTWLVGSWEWGDSGSRVLVVSNSVPPSAAVLVAKVGGSGISVWPPFEPDQVPGPVLWCRPEDFSDSTLGNTLAEFPPQVVLAWDLASWLPGAENEALDEALALRRILDTGSASVYLAGSCLSPAWLQFLGAVCGPGFHSSQPPGAFASSGSGSELGPAGETTAEPVGRRVPNCLDCGEAEVPAAVTDRLRRLLSRIRPILSSGPVLVSDQKGAEATGTGPSEDRLLSLDWLARLAGLRQEDLAEGIRLLRWAARLAGDTLSLAATESLQDQNRSMGHCLFIRHRFAELENIVVRLEEQARILLPLWLGNRASGVPVWVDLESPPVDLKNDELALLDNLLLGLGDPGLVGWCGLVYYCPAGSIHSSRRIIRCDVPGEAMLEKLSGQIRLFGSRLGDVMSSAVETGQGFLVETGLTDLRDEEREFLALGSALGFWTWSGPSCRRAVYMVDLLTLADSPTAQGYGPAWGLFGDLIRSSLGDNLPLHLPENVERKRSQGFGGRLVGSLRSWLPEQDEPEEQDTAFRRVLKLLDQPEGNSFLVLKGLAGSGRQGALLRALLSHRTSGLDPCEVTVYCPDTATAAGFVREARKLGLPGPLDIRIPQGSAIPGGPSVKESWLADSSRSVIIMCEIQRFEAETRYRISQAGRGQRLILTVDPFSSSEPWEHLFLTTPRVDDVVELGTQGKVCRRLWSGVSELVPPELQGHSGSGNSSPGYLVSDYSANLDHCLSSIFQEHQEGRLPGRIRLTGSVAGDLDYLGTRIRDKGWLSVAEKSLDILVQPGPCEFLAAATDVLARSGELARAFDPGLEDAPSLLPALLGPRAAQAASRWLGEVDLSGDAMSLTEFLGLMQTTDWAGTFLAYPEAVLRLNQLLDSWGGFNMARLLDTPLWEAWWYTMMDDLGHAGPERRRPLVALAATARPAGTWSPGGVYLCLGTEPARQHYQVLGRVTESSLILFQEQSPLPGEKDS